MASEIHWTVVGYFLPMMSIQKSVLFLSEKAWLHELLFVDWEIYDMLWCSQYCAKISRGVPLGAINIDFKYIIFDEEMILEINF